MQLPLQSLRSSLLSFSLLLALSAPASAQTADAVPANSLILLTGKIHSIGEESFVLDYGTGEVPVSLGSPDVAEEQQLKPGERVTVSGQLDEDFFGKHILGADTIFRHELLTYYPGDNAEAGPIDPGYLQSLDARDESTASTPVNILVGGEVSEINDRKFTLHSGQFGLGVDTARMKDNMLDDEGAVKLSLGTPVYVSGHIEGDIFNKPQILARSITIAGRAPEQP